MTGSWRLFQQRGDWAISDEWSADILSASGRSPLQFRHQENFGIFALRAQADRMSALRCLHNNDLIHPPST
jgi:hypothetical protein